MYFYFLLCMRYRYGNKFIVQSITFVKCLYLELFFFIISWFVCCVQNWIIQFLKAAWINIDLSFFLMDAIKKDIRLEWKEKKHGTDNKIHDLFEMDWIEARACLYNSSTVSLADSWAAWKMCPRRCTVRDREKRWKEIEKK